MGMRMPVPRGILLAVLAAAGLLAVAAGCSSSSTEDPPRGNGTAGKPAAPQPPQPLLDGWTKPAAAIVFSGEQAGFLEPCGCTELQSGGLGRRHALMKLLDEK